MLLKLLVVITMPDEMGNVTFPRLKTPICGLEDMELVVVVLAPYVKLPLLKITPSPARCCWIKALGVVPFAAAVTVNPWAFPQETQHNSPIVQIKVLIFVA